ncbi:MAG: hypothetical protein WBC05_19520 [Sedimentisphaerales bacterium]
MKHTLLICTIALTAMVWPGHSAAQTQQDKAGLRVNDLRLASYVTSRQVEQLATDQAVRTKALQTIRHMGITKLYLEVYRGGHVVSPEHLIFTRDWLQGYEIEIVGGIATVPGSDFGVRQKGPLGWFNWQNEKTQRDLEKVIRMAAGIFDTFIVDDFLCTGDISDESKAAKGDRSWGRYRRELLTELAQSVFIGPAKEVNPDITMIVKYPQWYDRFHLFGYDTKTLPELFDKVWVGTETRGRNTQRFGFVQPYEGFVNYRWLAGIAGDKIGGAWFDHGDCAEHDFIDQAYTSVLAGAAELVFFNFSNVMAGHPDHDKVIDQFDQLTDLAAFVREHPVTGVPAYKPLNSDPAGDMYIMDFLGMLGIPLVPVHKFPVDAPVIFLPAQAAADPDLLDHVNKARTKGTHLIFTTNLLIASPEGDKLARMVEVGPDIQSKPTCARLMQKLGKSNVTIDLEAQIEGKALPGNILCTSGDKQLTLLTVHQTSHGRIALLNTHTYSQADFDAVGEVLLCPRPLSLLGINEPALSALREAFGGTTFEGPSCVTYHPFDSAGSGSCVIQNFNDKAVNVTVTVNIQKDKSNKFMEAFSGKPIDVQSTGSGNRVALNMPIPARGRVWIRCVD